jgi:methylated-DNA-protein-cysteine methyltransferase-like protein
VGAEPAPLSGHRRPFDEAVVEVVRRTVPGEVLTYGEVAAEAGRPGAARAVGGVLARREGLPWWRVVTATGRLVPGLEEDHARRLRAEGVTVVGGRVAAPARPRR